jgi:FHS family L-fucose permease-like MFS transporter
MQQKTAFVFLVVLFFLWGFLTSLNDILIPHLESAFQLQGWQAQLVQFFFFGAYFVMSLPAGRFIGKFGYKPAIITGLIMMGAGCLVFYPAAGLASFPVFLLGLYILASGITLLQVAANPYVAVLGPPSTAASRLNLAQAVNSLGHTLAPLIGSAVILSENADVNSVQLPYVFLALSLFTIAANFGFIRLPRIEQEKPTDGQFQWKNHPELIFGALAIFFYVGAECSIGGHLVRFLSLPETGGLDTRTAGSYVSFYWGGAMTGRFIGGVWLSDLARGRKTLLVTAIPLAAFILAESWLIMSGNPPEAGLWFLGCIALNLGAFILSPAHPGGLIAGFALISGLLLLCGINLRGNLAMWAVLSIGLFNSVMWSNIFTLAIRKLGAHTNKGSSLLVMMIAGGAIIPEIQGLLRDAAGLQTSFVVPILCYVYLAWYGISQRPVREAQA